MAGLDQAAREHIRGEVAEALTRDDMTAAQIADMAADMAVSAVNGTLRICEHCGPDRYGMHGVGHAYEGWTAPERYESLGATPEQAARWAANRGELVPDHVDIDPADFVRAMVARDASLAQLVAEVLERPDAAGALDYVRSIAIGGPSCGCGADHWSCDFGDSTEDEGNWPEACEGCGAEVGEVCRPMCTGLAAHLDAQEDAGLADDLRIIRKYGGE